MPRRWNCRLRELECMGHTNRMYGLHYKDLKHRPSIHGLEDFYTSPGANDFLGRSVGDIMSRCALDITSSSATPESTLYHGAVEPRLSKIPAQAASKGKCPASTELDRARSHRTLADRPMAEKG